MSPLAIGRSAPWSPPRARQLDLWLRRGIGMYQDTPGTVPAGVGDPVGEWQDQTGNGNHATQATALERPTHQADAVNGHSALAIAASQWMALPNATDFATEASALVVVRSVWDNATHALFDLQQSGANPHRFLVENSNVGDPNWKVNAFVGGYGFEALAGDPSGVRVIGFSAREGGGVRVWRDGVPSAGGSVTAFAASDSQQSALGSRIGGTSAGGVSGQILDFMRAPVEWSAEEWAHITRWAQREYLSGLTPIDFFLIGGQSNAEGRGSSATSPSVTPGIAYLFNTPADLGSFESITGDPVSGAQTGSMWPSFINAYYAATGRRTVFMERASGGDSQVISWTAAHAEYLSSYFITQAINELKALGYRPTFRGVLWCQGETDALAIDAATETKAQYKAALEAMAAGFRGKMGATMPLWIWQTGRLWDGDTAGFLAVREAQAEVAAADPYTHIVYDNAVNWPSMPGYESGDNIHWPQIGLNDAGTVGGAYVAAALG